MSFKFTVKSVTAAIAAAATAFGTSWTLAATNATPGVQSGEAFTIGLAVVTAIAAALFHDETPTA